MGNKENTERKPAAGRLIHTEERRFTMKKRLLSLLLAAALLAALIVPASAATYSDLKGHWAETYIQKLSDLGYLNGYTDGTVRPNGTITTCEALALVSRLYKVDSDTASWIADDYGTFVTTNIDPTLSWAYDEIETDLAAGVLTESELLNLRLTTPIEKELLSVLLVRALKLTDEASALSSTKLTFDDASSVTEAYVGDVAALVNAKIIEGDSHNKFQPHSSVTRAVVSAMVVRGLNYIDTKGITLKVDGYENYAKFSGLLTAVSGGTFTFRDTTGVSRTYALPASGKMTVGTETKTMSASLTGLYATVRVANAKVQSVAAANDEGITWAQGILTDTGTATGGEYLYLKNLDTGKTTRYTALSSATVTIDGASSSLDKLAKNEFLTVKLSSDRITSIAAVPGSYTLTGAIAALTYGTTVTLTVSSDAGSSVIYLLDITNLPTILRGSNQVSIERLAVGDKLTVTVENGAVTKLSTTASESTIDGTLTSIVSTANGTTWLITDTAGAAHTLTVDSSAGVYSGSKSILLSDVQAGDTVSVVADGSVITEIYLKSSTGNTSTKLTATVLAVDTTKKRITALATSGKLVYISTSSIGTILDTASGKSISLSSLQANEQIVAYGTYSDSTTFNASSIVIEP